MQRFCQREHIRLDLASVAHPQSNGQAERANQELIRGIKPRLCVPLERTSGSWKEELPSVLWSIRMTPNRSTGYTPFFLVYGAKPFPRVTYVMTPLELLPMWRLTMRKQGKTPWIFLMKNEN